MKQWLGNLVERHPVRVILSVVLSIIGIGSIVRNIDTLNGIFERCLAAGIIVEATSNGKNVVHSTRWLFTGTALLVAACAAFALLYLRAEVGRRGAIRTQDETSTIAFKTLQGMMRASSRIRDQLFPTAQQPIKSFAAIDNSYFIHKDFSGEVKRTSEIRAVKEPLHFYAVDVGVTSYADPVEYLDNIGFKVRDETGSEGREVVYLPTLNDPRKKKIMVYFLPRIEPTDPPRRVTMSYHWPGMLNQLKKLGEEECNWTTNSSEEVPRVRIAIYTEPGIGGNLICELGGRRNGKQTLTQTTHQERGWPGWLYEIKDGPAGRTVYTLVLKLQKP